MGGAGGDEPPPPPPGPGRAAGAPPPRDRGPRRGLPRPDRRDRRRRATAWRRPHRAGPGRAQEILAEIGGSPRLIGVAVALAIFAAILVTVGSRACSSASGCSARSAGASSCSPSWPLSVALVGVLIALDVPARHLGRGLARRDRRRRLIVAARRRAAGCSTGSGRRSAWPSLRASTRRPGRSSSGSSSAPCSGRSSACSAGPRRPRRRSAGSSAAPSAAMILRRAGRRGARRVQRDHVQLARRGGPRDRGARSALWMALCGARGRPRRLRHRGVGPQVLPDPVHRQREGDDRVGARTDAARAEVLAARERARDVESGRLGRRDPRGGRHPGQDPARAAQVGGRRRRRGVPRPRRPAARILGRARRAIFGEPDPLPTSMLPDEIEQAPSGRSAPTVTRSAARSSGRSRSTSTSAAASPSRDVRTAQQRGVASTAIRSAGRAIGLQLVRRPRGRLRRRGNRRRSRSDPGRRRPRRRGHAVQLGGRPGAQAGRRAAGRGRGDEGALRPGIARRTRGSGTPGWRPTCTLSAGEWRNGRRAGLRSRCPVRGVSVRLRPRLPAPPADARRGQAAARRGRTGRAHL